MFREGAFFLRKLFWNAPGRLPEAAKASFWVPFRITFFKVISVPFWDVLREGREGEPGTGGLTSQPGRPWQARAGGYI